VSDDISQNGEHYSWMKLTADVRRIRRCPETIRGFADKSDHAHHADYDPDQENG